MQAMGINAQGFLCLAVASPLSRPDWPPRLALEGRVHEGRELASGVQEGRSAS
jgi:hypothetical protein